MLKERMTVGFFLICALLVCLHKTAQATLEQSVVRNIDVGKYMGRWYQIAAFPSRFQLPSYVNTRATYALNPNGTSFHVLNESWDNNNNGKRVSIEGIAFKAQPTCDQLAKFKVTFFVPPVTGDYWVLYVDDKYEQALVGHPTMEYLWILNREPQLDDNIYHQLVDRAKAEGYDVAKLQKTPQSPIPPPSAAAKDI